MRGNIINNKERQRRIFRKVGEQICLLFSPLPVIRSNFRRRLERALHDLRSETARESVDDWREEFSARALVRGSAVRNPANFPNIPPASSMQSRKIRRMVISAGRTRTLRRYVTYKVGSITE